MTHQKHVRISIQPKNEMRSNMIRRRVCHLIYLFSSLTFPIFMKSSTRETIELRLKEDCLFNYVILHLIHSYFGSPFCGKTETTWVVSDSMSALQQQINQSLFQITEQHNSYRTCLWMASSVWEICFSAIEETPGIRIKARNKN